MNLVIEQWRLKSVLQTSLRAAASRTTLPILQSVLLVAEDDRLSAGCTNLELSLEAGAEAEIKEPGRISTSARLLTEFVSTLPAGKVGLYVKGNHLHVETARSKAKFATMPAEEFPTMPVMDGGWPVPDQFKAELLRVIGSAADDESRPILTGVNLAYADGLVTLATADGFRLSVTQLAADEFRNGRATIPERTLAELARLLDGEATMTITESHAMFQVGDVLLTSVLIMGKFPDYSQIIPTNHPHTMTVDTAEMTRAVKTARIFAGDRGAATNLVKLDIGPALVVVAAQAEVGDGRAEVPCEFDGGDLSISFNGAYLLEALGAVGTEQTRFSLATAERPAMLQSDRAGDAWKCVLMPMYVSGGGSG